MVILDFFIVNVALPSMQADLHASDGVIEWVVAGYALTSAIFLIPAGRLGDRFGRRRLFSISLAIFVLASAACGAAATPTELVVARLVQGAAAALMTPNILAIIGVLYHRPDRARALSIYGTVMGLAAVGGQLIGGGLIALDVAHLAWRSCFLINVPIGAVALVLTPRLVPESRQTGSAGLDLTGMLLATATVTAAVFPLVEGRQDGWPLWSWIVLGAAPVLLGLLVAHQRRPASGGRGRLLDLSLFTERSFSAGLVAQLLFWGGQGSFFVVLALYLQEGRGLHALAAGLVFTILAGSYLLASIQAPVLAARHGRGVIIAGALTLAAGQGLLFAAVEHVGVGGSIVVLVPGLLLVGAGMGLVIAPLATIVLHTLDPERAGAASGLFTTMQNVGNALGVAVTGVVFFGGVHRGYAHAFELSVTQLGVLLLIVAASARLLPKKRPDLARIVQ
jgi:EmrB/QacA subfamily drug resistance transporter